MKKSHQRSKRPVATSFSPYANRRARASVLREIMDRLDELEQLVDQAFFRGEFTKDDFRELTKDFHETWLRLLNLTTQSFNFEPNKKPFPYHFHFDPILLHGDGALGSGTRRRPTEEMEQVCQEYVAGFKAMQSLVGNRLSTKLPLKIHVVRNDHPSLEKEGRRYLCAYSQGECFICYLWSPPLHKATAGWIGLRHLWENSTSRWKKEVQNLFHREVQGSLVTIDPQPGSQPMMKGKRFWSKFQGIIPTVECFPGCIIPSVPDAGFECYGCTALTFWAATLEPHKYVGFFRKAERRKIFFELLGL